MHSLGIVQWDFTRRDHPGKPGGVSGSGPVTKAEPLATITEQKVRNVVWRSIICRFGIPRFLLSDNRKQFDNPKFRDFCAELGIKT